jgi:tRNA nucleotidyltransferase (CCA-adding enzyme)
MRLAEELMRASMDYQIHTELHRKVSRERVGKELEGMLSGKHADPQKALQMICDLRLAGGVLCMPPPHIQIRGTIGQAHLDQVPYIGETVENLAHLRQRGWEESRECLTTLKDILDVFPQQNKNQTFIDPRLVFLATFLLPFEHLQYEDKTKVKYVAEYMMRDGIKFKNTDVQGVITMTQNLDDMIRLLQRLPDASPAVRLQAGLILRNVKELWVTLLIVAAVNLLRRKAADTDVDWCKRSHDWYGTIIHG